MKIVDELRTRVRVTQAAALAAEDIAYREAGLAGMFVGVALGKVHGWSWWLVVPLCLVAAGALYHFETKRYYAAHEAAEAELASAEHYAQKNYDDDEF